jgi:hypothetical protein
MGDVEGKSVTQRWIFAAFPVLAASVIAPSAVASLLACSTVAHAEPMRLAQAVEYGGGLPPYEIVTIVRSAGLDPIDRPVRRGPNYVLHAIGQNDQEVRVVVSAHRGEIVRIVPTMSASRMPPGPGGAGMGPYERMDGYEPPRAAPGYVAPEGYRYGARPVTPDDEEDDAAYADGNAPRPPGSVPGSASRPGYAPAPRTGYADPPPVIRATPPAGSSVSRGADLPPPSGVAAPPPYAPRAATAYPPPRSTDLPPSRDPQLANVPPPVPGRDGLLPPPPERFPQRAAPAQKKEPKPVKRAAATAAPKLAPMPKPKPEHKPAATPASAQAPVVATPATPAPEVAKEPAKETAKPAATAAPPTADTKPAPESKPSAEPPVHDPVPN